MPMKRHGATPEEDIIEWIERMGFTPETMSDIWEARTALGRMLEDTTQYPGTDAQKRAMDWAVRNVYRPMHEAGVRPFIRITREGVGEIRYGIKGLRGGYTWEHAREIIQQRTGVWIKWIPY